MIAGNFLRRIELNPSDDLDIRQDLLLFQVEKPLNALEWFNLAQDPTPDFIKTFDDAINHFYTVNQKADDWFKFRAFKYISIKNASVIELCLLNRVRHERGLTLVTLQESQWVDYVAYMTLNLDDKIKELFNNAIV